jgi:hypothetical protein
MQEIDKLGWLCVRDRRLLGARSQGRRPAAASRASAASAGRPSVV